jgi:hypothetical protein
VAQLAQGSYLGMALHMWVGMWKASKFIIKGTFLLVPRPSLVILKVNHLTRTAVQRMKDIHASIETIVMAVIDDAGGLRQLR